MLLSIVLSVGRMFMLIGTTSVTGTFDKGFRSVFSVSCISLLYVLSLLISTSGSI